MTLFFYSEKHNSVHFLYLNQRPIKNKREVGVEPEETVFKHVLTHANLSL